MGEQQNKTIFETDIVQVNFSPLHVCSPQVKLSVWYFLSIQRIETKRHRVCLEVPNEVVPKDEDEDDAEQYGKRPRLSLMPPRTSAQDGKRNKGFHHLHFL